MRVDVTEIKSFIRQSETVAVEFDGDDELRLNVDAYIVVSIATSTPFIVHCSLFIVQICRIRTEQNDWNS